MASVCQLGPGDNGGHRQLQIRSAVRHRGLRQLAFDWSNLPENNLGAGGVTDTSMDLSRRDLHLVCQWSLGPGTVLGSRTGAGVMPLFLLPAFPLSHKVQTWQFWPWVPVMESLLSLSHSSLLGQMLLPYFYNFIFLKFLLFLFLNKISLFKWQREPKGETSFFFYFFCPCLHSSSVIIFFSLE